RLRAEYMDEVPPDWMLVVHGVERDHALDVGGRQPQHFDDFRHVTVRDPAARPLHQPQRRQERRLPGGVARQDFVELLEHLFGEDGLVLLRARWLRRMRADTHRSTSPMTMSTEALIAIKSLNRCPAAIRGRAERLMNEGGRMRQRTGFAVPSDTR